MFRTIRLPIIVLLALGLTALFVIVLPAQHRSVAESSQLSSPAVELGPPGTVFHYEQTFGETGVPYLVDVDHLYSPRGLGLDGDDNLWVAEADGTRVLKYEPDGQFLMSIGTAGTPYLADETHFNRPVDVAVANDGSIWVVDMGSIRVVKFAADGSYLTQVGVTWEAGDDNDHFLQPISVATDSADNLYISDLANHRIQVFDSSGAYAATIGLTGIPGSGNNQFDWPAGIAIDESDYLYVADLNNNRVQIFEPGHNYAGTISLAFSPRAVAVDADFIYVVDVNGHQVQILDRTTHDHVATLGAYGSGDLEFDTPTDVGVDSNGDIYVLDALNFRVQKYGFDGENFTYLGTIGETGVPYLTDGSLYNHPADVSVDAAGNVAIVEGWGLGHRLIKLDASGVPLFTIGDAGICGAENDQFCSPNSVVFDPAGNLYVADCGNDRIQIFSSSGVYSATLGSYGQGDYEFACPSGLAFDRSGNLYVADPGNYRVQIFDSSLTYIATLGETAVQGDDNDHFLGPDGVAVDSAGNIYVTDPDTRVQKFDSSYAYVATLGVTGESGNDFDHFYGPHDVDVDAQDYVYVADQGNSRVQVFDSSGAYLTTIGGAWGSQSGQLTDIYGIGLDSQGNVYIPDAWNFRIQKFAPGVPGWEQVNINGFGDRNVDNLPSLEVFDGSLYAGTSNYNDGIFHLYRTADSRNWDEIGHDFDAGISALIAFDEHLIAGTWDGSIWRSPDGLAWTQLMTTTQGIAHFGVFNDAVYAGTYSSDGTTIWKSSDGIDWSPFVTDGNGDPNAMGVISSAEFAGAFYFGVADWSGTTGGRIWRTDGTTITEVVGDGFGDVENRAPGGLAAFRDWLYVSIYNPESQQVWRSDSGDPGSWSMVLELSPEEPALLDRTGLIVHDNRLFLTAQNDVSGMQVWMTDDGQHWMQIGDVGLGDSNNWYTEWSSPLAIFHDRLHMGVINYANGAEVWRYMGFSNYLPLIAR